MRNFNYMDAILSLRPNALFDIFQNNYSTLKWYDENQVKPTEKEITDKLEELKTEFEKNLYKDHRMTNYPSIGDQLDMIWHCIDSGATLDNNSDFYKTIKIIKEKYPKAE